MLSRAFTFAVNFHFKRCLSSKVPEKPTWTTIDRSRLPQEPRIDREVVELLERLSLVEFNNQEGVDRLMKAVHSANLLHAVNTDNVQPMDSVLEDRVLYLRDDSVTDENRLSDIMKNATKTLEDYYIAPPGNIPLKQKEKDYGNGN